MKSFFVIITAVLALSSMVVFAQQAAPVAQGVEQQNVEQLHAVIEGKRVAFDRSKGNCLACHMMDDGEMPGMAGPALLMMKQRYPESDKLRAQIWDPTTFNPKSRMPPFGRHGMLTEQEIDNIVAYLYTL